MVINHRHTRTGFARPLAAPSGLGLRPRATRPLRGGRISARPDWEWRKRKRRASVLVCGLKQNGKGGCYGCFPKSFQSLSRSEYEVWLGSCAMRSPSSIAAIVSALGKRDVSSTDVSAIMPLALQDFERVFIGRERADAEDDAVCLVDAYAPPSAEIAAKRFGIADAGRTVAVYALEKQVDALECFGVFSLPGNILIPCTFVPYLTHGPAPRRLAVHALRRFGGRPSRWRGAQVHACCCRNRRGRPLLQRAVYHAGGTAV